MKIWMSSRIAVIVLLIFVGLQLVNGQVVGQQWPNTNTVPRLVSINLPPLPDGLDMRLLEAVYASDLEVVKSLVEIGANVNARDFEGISVLMYSLYAEDEQITDLLLSEGADIHAIDFNGNSVLLHAFYAGQEDFIRENMPEFELVNHKNSDGYSALTFAVQQYDVELVQQLIEKGANIHQKTEKGTTAVMHAAAFGNFYVVDYLAYLGADVNHQAQDGSSALHLAAWYGHNEVAGLLLDWGADIEISDYYGNTPLMIAIMGQQLETTWYLHESGASLMVVNEAGLTPLSQAASLQDQDIVNLILQYDFKEPLQLNKKRSAIAYAYYNRDYALQQQLIDFDIKPRGLYFSEFWINQGMDYNDDDFMYHAALGLFESRFKLLLKLSFLVRTQAKKLMVQESENLSYQFFESRDVWSLGLYREFTLFNAPRGVKAGIMPGIEGAYSTAGYRGTGMEAPAGFSVIPAADIFVHYRGFSLFAGYNYWNTGQNDVSAHRFRIGAAYRLSLLKKPSLGYRPVLN